MSDDTQLPADIVFPTPLLRPAQLADAEIAAEVAADLRHDFDDAVADLAGQLVKLLPVQFAEVVRRVDGVEERHGRLRRLRIAVRR